MESLFGGVDNDDNYYKSVLVKTSFKDDYKYYENRGDRDKKRSIICSTINYNVADEIS